MSGWRLGVVAKRQHGARRGLFYPVSPMNTFKLDTRLTSRTFRCAVLTAFPNASTPERLRLLLYLLLSPWLDANGRTVLTYSQLAACDGSTEQAKGRNFTSTAFLQDFESYILPLDLQSARWASKGNSHARTACPVWPEPVLTALKTELELSSKDRLADAVYFVSGHAYKPRQHKENLAMLKRQALEQLLQHDHPALSLMQYANSQQSTVFNRLVEKHIDHARDVAMSIEKYDTTNQLEIEMTHSARSHALRILHGLESDAMPTYKPSEKGNTARIFSDGLSYLGLPKAVRRALMPECPELDLANAQLAIAARDWNIPEVQTFLATGQKIWPELERYFDLAPDLHKPILKSTLYALLFGMEKAALVRHLAHGGPDETGRGIGSEKAKTLFKHPLISALYIAREQQLHNLLEAGTAQTCFNQTIPVTNKKQARSALAAQAQAVELWILLPAVDLLKNNTDLKLVAWQHDGFTVHSSNKTKIERYVNQLQKAVNERANQAGYNTSLERSA